MRNKNVFFWLLVFLPLIVVLIVFPQMPDVVPAHYGLDGTVSRWGSKYEIFILPIVTILMGVFLVKMGDLARKNKDNGTQNEKVLFITNCITIIIFNVLSYWFIYTANNGVENLYDSNIDMMKILSIVLCISFIFVGNILPKCKKNALVGIRTRWTLKNEHVWYKTHRFGSKLMIISEIISIGIICIFALNGTQSLFIAIGGFMIVTMILIIYSYSAYKIYLNNNS